MIDRVSPDETVSQAMAQPPPPPVPPSGPDQVGAVAESTTSERIEAVAETAGAACCVASCLSDGDCTPSVLLLGWLLVALTRRLPESERHARPGARQWAARRVRAYQLFVSPRLPPRCNLEPTCSSFALHALDTHAPARATRLIGGRLRACHDAGRHAQGRREQHGW